MSSEALELGIGLVHKIADLWRGGKAESLIDYTRAARVEPIVVIDADCLYLESLSEVQQSLLSIFAGYYLQAISLSLTVGKIDVMRHLDKLNPTRNAADSAISGAAGGISWLLAQESYKYALPLPQKRVALEAIENDVREDAREMHRNKLALEAQNQSNDDARLQLEYDKFDFNASTVYAKQSMDAKQFQQKIDEAQRTYDFNREKFGHERAMKEATMALQKQGMEINQRKMRDTYSASEIGFGRDTMSALKDVTNLSVGKLFTVEITDGLHKASIPVSIRLMASSMPSSSLVHILSHGQQDNSAKERYHAWKAGRLSFIKDLVMCQDLIDAHRKNLMADKDGLYTNILQRNRTNQLSAIVSANPSVATASNLVIISDETAAALELKVEGKLKDFHVRERIFKETYIMIMAVIDKQWERVTFYHRGINMPTEVGMRDLKAANKGNGPDVSDILKAYQMGNSPSL